MLRNNVAFALVLAGRADEAYRALAPVLLSKKNPFVMATHGLIDLARDGSRKD